MTRAGWDLIEAIGAGQTVLAWMERGPDELPPPHIWHHAERLEEFFAAVKQRREDQMRGLESVPQATEDDEGSVTNELAKGLRD